MTNVAGAVGATGPVFAATDPSTGDIEYHTTFFAGSFTNVNTTINTDADINNSPTPGWQPFTVTNSNNAQVADLSGGNNVVVFQERGKQPGWKKHHRGGLRSLGEHARCDRRDVKRNQ